MRDTKKIAAVFKFLLVLLLLFVLLFSLLKIVQKTTKQRQEPQVYQSKTVVHDGVEYYPRQDIDVMLVMGIDEYGPVKASNSYNNTGEADTLLLLVFDHTNRQIHALNINRDTMAEIPVLGVDGRSAGTVFAQLALSHTYGSGLEDSCENTRTAVSAMLGGVPIEYYVSMNMDVVGIISDAVGGVPVRVTENFEASGSDIPMGETTLRGDQAIEYVRFRKNVGDEKNVSRMKRQMEFVDSFFVQLQKKLEQEPSFALTTYDEVSDYIVTDCSSTVLVSMMERYGDYELVKVKNLPGENRQGERYMEFYVEEQAKQKLVLELFYAPK